MGIIRVVDKFKNKWIEFIRKKDENHKELDDNEYYASQLSSDWRKIAELRKELEVDDTLAGIFKIGEIIHQILQDNIFKNYKIEERVERIINKDYNIKVRGRADVVGKEEVIEIKTISELPDLPKEEHLAQIHFYMYAFGIKKGYLIYVKKNTLEMKEFEIEFSDSYWSRVVNAVMTEYRVRKNGMQSKSIDK